MVYNCRCIIEPFFRHGFLFQANLNEDSLNTFREVFHQEGEIIAIETYPPTKKWLVGSIYKNKYTSPGHYGIIYFNDTIDGNSDWIVQYVDSLEDRILTSIVFTDSLHGWACGSKGIILNTEDGGVIWKEQLNNINTGLWNIHFYNNKLGWIVGRQGIILNTINGGEIWNEQMSNTAEDLWTVTSISTDTVWAGGANSTLMQTFDGGNMWVPSLITGINNEATQLKPEKLILKQNYPNPFNPETIIKLELPKNSYVRLEIYNILGQKIRTLIFEQITAGVHLIKWDGKDDFGRNVSSGIYLYKIEAVGFVQVKKMFLLR